MKNSTEYYYFPERPPVRDEAIIVIEGSQTMHICPYCVGRPMCNASIVDIDKAIPISEAKAKMLIKLWGNK